MHTRVPEDSEAVSIVLAVHGSVKTARRGWLAAASSGTLGSLLMGWLGALEIEVLTVELDIALDLTGGPPPASAGTAHKNPTPAYPHHRSVPHRA